MTPPPCAAPRCAGERRERPRRRRQREREQTIQWLYRRLTSRWRRLPEFLIIGAQRSGTSSTYAYLAGHPRVRRAWRKEVHYFDSRPDYKRGDDWYRSHFPLRGPGVASGEATPEYMFRADAPPRMAQVVGGARLLALLRDPVHRAVSQYHHEVRGGRESRSFEAALEQQPRARGQARRSTDTYLVRGLYAEQIEAVWEHFPREQLLVLPSETLFARPAETLARIFAFLGLPDAPVSLPAHVGSQYEAMPPALRARLVEFFRPHNARLYDLLGQDLGWER